MQSAFYFLAAAHFLESRDAKESARAFHQAGQQLHRIGQFTQAGRAYSSAGRQAERAARMTTGTASQHEPLNPPRVDERPPKYDGAADRIGADRAGQRRDRSIRLSRAGRHRRYLAPTASQGGTSIRESAAGLVHRRRAFRLRRNLVGSGAVLLPTGSQVIP